MEAQAKELEPHSVDHWSLNFSLSLAFFLETKSSLKY